MGSAHASPERGHITEHQNLAWHSDSAGARHTADANTQVAPDVVVVHFHGEPGANHLQDVVVDHERELLELVGLLVFF